MNKNDQIFSIEYVPEKVSNTEDRPSEKIDIKIENEKYGIAKPIRIIIEGKIAHD